MLRSKSRPAAAQRSQPTTLTSTPQSLIDALATAAGDPGLVGTRPIDRLALRPRRLALRAGPQRGGHRRATRREVGRLFAAAAAAGVPLTFRSGGTSLVARPVTDGILVDTRTQLPRHRGARRRRPGPRRPGATVRQVNARLARHGRKLGPDPASEIACTHRRCRREQLQRHGLRHGGQHLPDAGVAGRSCCPAARSSTPARPTPTSGCGPPSRRCTRGWPGCATGCAATPSRCADHPAQFAMKNTMGYGLNSLLDHTRPVDILTHLVIGSEGTLAFIASAVFRTVPLLRHATTGLLVFEDLPGATGVAARAGLHRAGHHRTAGRDVAAGGPGRPGGGRDHPPDHRRQARGPAGRVPGRLGEALTERVAAAAGPVLRSIPVAGPAELTADPGARAALWHTRKGLYTTVNEARPSGTTALLEDIVVPVPQLLDTCEQLIELFAKHGYTDSVIFGHAKDGNIHFMLTERLGGGGDLRPVRRVHRGHGRAGAGHGGNLKAEHGTGRIMAPFVRRQYGDELYEVTRRDQAAVRPGRAAQPGRDRHRRRPAPTCGTSRSPRPSRRRWTAAWSAATANRSARAGT